MPTFHVAQNEICFTTYEVKAASEAEAIAKLINGDGQCTFHSHQFVEIAERCGLSAEDHPQLAEDLRTLDVLVGKIIPSIRSVRRIE